MKGINELIGAISLIGISIVIAAYIATWGVSFTHSEGAALGCATTTNYVIDSANFNKSGDDILLIKITNHDSMGLYGFGAVVQNSTDYIQFIPSEIDQGGISINAKLANGESEYIRINMSELPVMGNTLTRLTVFNEPCPIVSTTAPIHS